MELWIRSQDKKLLCKCDSLFIEEELYKRKGKYRIMANNGWLGEYDKLERALEILDEIQEAQLENYHYRCPSNVKISNNVKDK